MTLAAKTKLIFVCFCILKEETLRGRPGYEHLNDPLHILVEAELPVGIIDARLRQAREIIEELLKPVVFTYFHMYFVKLIVLFSLYFFQRAIRPLHLSIHCVSSLLDWYSFSVIFNCRTSHRISIKGNS